MKRKNTEASLSEILLGEGVVIYEVKEFEKEIHLNAQTEKKEWTCPKCQQPTSQISTDYFRKLQHVPLRVGKTTWVNLHSYKYQCIHPGCQHIFVQPLSFARKSQHRTDVLNSLVLSTAVLCSCNGAARMLKEMGVKITANSIQNLIDRIEFTDNPDVLEVGIDDIAIRKGNTYCTIVYDSQTREPLAVLEGRDGLELRKWLLDHPKIRMIERDRASAYARVIGEVLPHCIQIADRFHLLQNMTEHLKKILYASLPEKIYVMNGEIQEVKGTGEIILDDEIPADTYTREWPVDEKGNPLEFNCSTEKHNKRRRKQETQNRLKKVQKVLQAQEMFTQNIPKKEIREILGISQPTLDKYLKLDAGQIEKMKQPKQCRKPGKLAEWAGLIYKMLRDGYSPEVIAAHIMNTYHPDSTFGSLKEYAIVLRFNNRIRPAQKTWCPYQSLVLKITRTDILRQLICQDEKKQNKQIRQLLPILMHKYPQIRQIKEMYDEFYEAVMGKNPDKIDQFVEKYEEGILENFCQSVKKDTAPIKNAVSYSQSSGYVEGCNQKCKVVKRIVYGRIKLVNFEKRIKLAFKSSDSKTCLSNMTWCEDGRIRFIS